jgi:hypothetical protein
MFSLSFLLETIVRALADLVSPLPRPVLQPIPARHCAPGA